VRQAEKSAQQVQNNGQSHNGASVGETDSNSHFLKHDTASLELIEVPLNAIMVRRTTTDGAAILGSSVPVSSRMFEVA
jgi:hypothetical protein